MIIVIYYKSNKEDNYSLYNKNKRRFIKNVYNYSFNNNYFVWGSGILMIAYNFEEYDNLWS